MLVFGMARSFGADVAEALDLIDRHVRVAGEVKQRVKEHRAVAVRDQEAVAVDPVRVRGVEAHEIGEQHRSDIGHAHGHAWMAALGLLDCVHR
jgi:hypothetical protein